MTDQIEAIAPETLAQLEALDISRDRPLIAVDADEVLVIFVEHLSSWMATIGFEMRLERYELEGSMFPEGSDDPLPFDECIGLINRFFKEQTLEQQAVDGAADALSRLAEVAQIVVLTNVPRLATETRRQNLHALGMPYPVVVNSGGKGRAMVWLCQQTDAPVGFIDDSVKQIESVARHAPDVVRVHFAWADFIDRFYPECPDASARVRSWEAAENALRQGMALP